jgi:DNA-binding transcriptional MerR regulator
MASTKKSGTKPSAAVAASADTGGGVDEGTAHLRMRDLVRETGVPRETVHFYIAEGLLPRPIKTGRNTALYTREHLERLRTIKQLQETQFLPLKAIKAVFDESSDTSFTSEQERLVREIRRDLQARPLEGSATPDEARVAVSELVPEVVCDADLREFARMGVIEVRGRGARASVGRADAELLGIWAEIQRLSAESPRPVEPDAVLIYERAMEALVEREAQLMAQIFEGADPERVAEFVRRGIPLLDRFLQALHRRKIDRFFDRYS